MDHKDLKSLPKDTTYDRIFAWYVNEDSVQLSETEIKQRDRWQKCWFILCNERTLEQTVNIIQRLYKDEISRATAYRDVKNATKLFGEVTKTSKESKRSILQQYCDRIYKIAMGAGDLEAANRAIANMIKLGGLDIEDPDIPDFTKLEQHIYNIEVAPELIQVLKVLASRGALNLSEVRKEQAATIDIPHTDAESTSTP